MEDLERALTSIAEHRNEASFLGPISALRVYAAEKALGFKLPPTYRRFVLELGAGHFGGAEIYGVIDIDFERSSAPDAVWATLRAREENNLPADLVVLGYDDDEIACLQVRPKGAEGPVLVINAGEDPERSGTHTAAEDFGAYLLSRVEQELEALQ
jgi:hypothetical protein